MKMFSIFLFCFIAGSYAFCQPNCSVYSKDDPCYRGCEIYLKAIGFTQGSFESQKMLDSVISICPAFSDAWREKSVPYLKNGEFIKWKELMDKAVEYNPREYLNIRASCRYQFLRDYEGTLEDIIKIRNIQGRTGFSTDGDYDMRIIEALCYRELGNFTKALEIFDRYIALKENKKEDIGVGYYDYLHRGVTRLKSGFIQEAIADFESQFAIYKDLPDTYYYCALAYLELNNKPQADFYFKKADALFREGYRRNDTYVESLDKVYPGDLIKYLR